MERDNLRLILPVLSRKIMSAVHLKDLDQPEEGQTAGRKPSDRDAAITNMIAEHSTDKTQEIIDSKTGELIKDTMGRKASDRFENILGITRVAMKSREGAPQGGAKVVDFIISKLPKPTSSRAEMARDGGKIYSNVVYRALGNFIDKVNQGFGFNIDKSKLMKDVDENMNNQQKAVKVWTGFGGTIALAFWLTVLIVPMDPNASRAAGIEDSDIDFFPDASFAFPLGAD